MDGNAFDFQFRMARGDAVAEANHLYANVKKLDDLPRHFVKELEDFFVNYHRLEGKEYKLLGCGGSGEALRFVKQAKKAA